MLNRGIVSIADGNLYFYVGGEVEGALLPSVVD